MRTSTRIVSATAVAGALFLGSAATPAVMADGEPPSKLAAVAAVNPLAPEQADAAWWHFAVRDWGRVCGHVWLGGDRYEVKKQAYGYTSSKPTCQRTGKTVILRNYR